MVVVLKGAIFMAALAVLSFVHDLQRSGSVQSLLQDIETLACETHSTSQSLCLALSKSWALLVSALEKPEDDPVVEGQWGAVRKVARLSLDSSVSLLSLQAMLASKTLSTCTGGITLAITPGLMNYTLILRVIISHT